MTDIYISARRGAGAPAEILYGTVTFKPTLAHSRSTSIVLPAPTTFDLVDGEVVATNVQPTPEPVEGKIEWAYEVTFKDRHSKTYSFLVGVPDSSTQVNFTSLPRYYETQPPLFGEGPQGEPGEAATVAVGTVSSGTTAQVTNSGTNTDAVLNFTLPKGDKGDKGDGVPTGGSALQYIRKNAGNTATEWATLDKSAVGLGNVDNTSDANKPVSTAQKAYIDSSTTLPGRSKAFTDAPDTYPLGTTSTIVSPAEGWPQHPEGTANVMQVTTQRNASNFGGITQFISPWNTPEIPIKYRVSKADNTWGEFYTLAKDDGTLSRKGEDYILASDYGAKPFDETVNNKWTLQAAIAAAGGKDIVLQSGGEYYVAGTIMFPSAAHRRVSIRTDGPEPAILYTTGQSNTVMEFTSGSVVTTKTLVNDVYNGGHGWTVNNVTGVSVGMICEVISSKLWYFDPRPGEHEARRSELHRVKRIEGSTVFFEDPANDGYLVGSEGVELRFYDPIYVKLDNITVRGVHRPIAEETAAIQGLVVEGADEPKLSNVSAINCARTGVVFSRSYRPYSEGGYTRGANNYWNGYGLSVRGCAHAHIKDRMAIECRRGVDITGFNCISRNTVLENITVIGGGTNSRGETYGFLSDGSIGADQSGMGTHGGSDNASYINCRTFGVKRPFSFRGRNEVLVNPYVVGRAHGGVIQLSFGSNLWVKGGVISSGVWSYKETALAGGQGAATLRADSLVRTYHTYSGNTPTSTMYGRISIEGVSAELKDCVLFLASEITPPLGMVKIANNDFYFGGVSSSSTPSIIYYTGAATTTSKARWFIGPNSARQEVNGSEPVIAIGLSMTGAKVLDYTVQT